MATHANLVRNVLNDLKRTNLTAECSAAIISAIKYYDHRPWDFNEGSHSFTTTSTTSSYALPSDYRSMDYAEAEWPGDNWQELRKRSFSHIRRMLEGQSVSGYPENYAIRDKKIHLAYQPNSDYHVKLYYKRALPAGTSSASTAWHNELQDLIGARASWRVALGTMHDRELADMYKQMELDAELQAQTDHEQRTTNNKIKPHY